MLLQSIGLYYDVSEVYHHEAIQVGMESLFFKVQNVVRAFVKPKGMTKN